MLKIKKIKTTEKILGFSSKSKLLILLVSSLFIISGFVAVGFQLYVARPATPDNFNLSPSDYSDTGYVYLNWTEPKEGITIQHYKIYRGSSPDFKISDMNLVGITKETKYTDFAYYEGTIYYKITSVSIWGKESAPTEALSVDVDVLSPRTPDPTIELLKGGEVNISWAPQSQIESNPIYYEILRGTEKNFKLSSENLFGSYGLETNVDEDGQTHYNYKFIPHKEYNNYFIDKTVKDGETYYYRVLALDEAGRYSFVSREVSITVDSQGPEIPNASISHMNEFGVPLTFNVLKWESPLESDVTYNIYRGDTESFVMDSNSLLVTGISKTSFIDYDVPNNKAYNYKLRAVDEIGNEGPAQTLYSGSLETGLNSIVFIFDENDVISTKTANLFASLIPSDIREEYFSLIPIQEMDQLITLLNQDFGTIVYGLHGSSEGLFVGNEMITWNELGQYIDESNVNNHVMISCYSSLLANEVENKLVIGMNGEVDYMISVTKQLNSLVNYISNSLSREQIQEIENTVKNYILANIHEYNIRLLTPIEKMIPWFPNPPYHIATNSIPNLPIVYNDTITISIQINEPAFPPVQLNNVSLIYFINGSSTPIIQSMGIGPGPWNPGTFSTTIGPFPFNTTIQYYIFANNTNGVSNSSAMNGFTVWDTKHPFMLGGNGTGPNPVVVLYNTTDDFSPGASGIKKVFVYYRNDTLPLSTPPDKWYRIPMQYGRNASKPNEYNVTMPNFPFRTNISLFFNSSDWANNFAIDDNNSNYYHYVINGHTYIQGENSSKRTVASSVDMMVQLKDQFGVPIPGLIVNFSKITDPNGNSILNASSAVTDSYGRAFLQVTLDNVSGITQIRFNCSDPYIINGSFVVEIEGIPDSPQNIEITSGYNVQNIVNHTEVIEFNVTDQYGNPIKDLKMNFTITSSPGVDNATLDKTTTETQSNGYGNVSLKLSAFTGNNIVKINVSSVEGFGADIY
ncbi:MAG: hypothetical protein ACTSVY_10390, partial [Candidatus Helarchaeota archaeon]